MLRAWVDQWLPSGKGDSQLPEARAAVVPHGGDPAILGLMGQVYGTARWPGRLVLIGPQHNPGAERFGIAATGRWHTPLGAVEVDRPLAKAVAEASAGLLQEAPELFEQDHGLELQIPFLQRLGKFRFVPILVAEGSAGEAVRTGRAVAEGIGRCGGAAAVVATALLSRYVPETRARVTEDRLLERMLRLDAEGVLAAAAGAESSPCGLFAAAAALEAVRLLGVKQVRLIGRLWTGPILEQGETGIGAAGLLVA